MTDTPREIAERWLKSAERKTPPFYPDPDDALLVARALIAAEQKVERLRGKLEIARERLDFVGDFDTLDKLHDR